MGRLVAGRARMAAALAAALALAGGLYVSHAAEPVPIPAPTVTVTTQSGSVNKTVTIPMGGLPTAIDVDAAGSATPDVDVSVAMIAAEELPGTPVVPTISVVRNLRALRNHTPAPPLRIDFRIDVVDAANDLAPIASVTYGYETPAGGRVPASFKTKLLGEITGAFIDPLEVAIETPGYEAPLTLNARAKTGTLDADFRVSYDPIPSRVHFVEDPRPEGDPAGQGLNFKYDHEGGVEDVDLTGTARLAMAPDWSVRDIAVGVERLPRAIELDYAKLGGGDATIVYTASNAARKPDVDATYRETSKDGVLETDVSMLVAGLPAAMRADLRGTESDGEVTLDSADFRVTDGGQVDAVDFVARNWAGDPGTVPVVDARPGQYIAYASRIAGDGSERYRAAGHVEGVRAVRWERVPSGDHHGFDIVTDIGDGVRPLRALMDADGRGPGGSEDANHLVLDTTVTPLPRTIHARMVPGADKEKPMTLRYEAATPVDVDADVRIEKGTGTACGQALVTCAKARVERLPQSLGLELLANPGLTDFTFDRADGHDPDVSAVVDATGSDPADRTWADIRLDRIPRHVRGRVESPTDVVTNAAFHTCGEAFTDEGKCLVPDEVGLGRATFTLRDRPERTGLPQRPDVPGNHVTLLARGETDEISGHLTAIRNVELRQRDRNGDGVADGTLGYHVDAGRREPFAVHVDTVGPDADHPAHDRTVKVEASVDELPQDFRGCLRESAEVAPPELPGDHLMSPCDTQTVDGQPVDSTPLTVYYKADIPLTADVDFDLTAPQKGEDGAIVQRTTEVTTHVANVPRELRLDAVAPIAPGGPQPPRDLSVVYQADAPIDAIDVDFHSRGPADVCADPRPGRETLCLKAHLKDVPSKVAITSNPDPAVGTIDVKTAAPAVGDRFDITGLELAMTEPDGKRPMLVDADVLGIPTHMRAQIQSLVAPGETDPRLARVHFDACPDGKPTDPGCTGIGRVTFDARDGFFADTLPSPPSATPPPGTIRDAQSLTYVARGDDFRARGEVANLKEVGFSLLDSTGAISPLTTVTAALEPIAGDWLRLYVNADDGKKHTILDAVATDLPERLDLCLREQVAEADVHTGSKVWCEAQKATNTALQARFGTPRGGGRADLDVRNLLMHRYAGNGFLGGSMRVTDLAPRLDILAGPGPDPEIEIQARTDEGTLVPSPIGRITFALKDHLDLSGLFGMPAAKQFPFAPLDSTTPAPETDPRNVDPDGVPNAGHNYLRVESDPTRLAIKGSVPAIERLALKPDRCDPDDVRFPARSLFAANKRPDYLCAMAVLGRGRPLSFAVRTLDADGKAIAIDDGHVTALPNGAGGLAATIATAPDSVANAPVCTSFSDPFTTTSCRPPLFSLHADRTVLVPPVFSARMAIGALEHLRELKATSPLDVHSRRLNYERRPADYSLEGARVKTGTWDDGFALRAGLRVKLARFLDLDPPTTYSCIHATTTGHQPFGDCLGSDARFGADYNDGAKVSNTFFKLTMAENEPGGTSPYPLGRGALMMRDFAQDGGSELVITGATDGAEKTGTSSITPEGGLPDGDHINGALLPSHLDVRVRERTLYDAVRNSEHQRQYLQVDARTDDPLTATFRMNDREMGFNRAGQAVAPITLVLRNAPGRAQGVTGWASPNFRLRTMITSPFKISEEEERNDLVDGCGTTEGSQTYDAEHDVGGAFCIRLPTPKSQWLQAQLNAQPDASSPPARTIDTIVNRGVAEDVNPDGTPDQDVDGATTEAEIRGFAEVLNGSSSGATPARVTAQVGTRLTSFNFGLKIGAAFGLAGYFSEYKTLGDLIIDIGANNVTRMRPRANTGRVLLQSRGGPTSIHTNYDAFSSWYELYTFFGGDVRLPIRSDSGGRYRHPLGVLDCETLDTYDHGVGIGEVGNGDFARKYSLGLFGKDGLYHPPGSLPTLSFAAFRLAADHIWRFNCFVELSPGYMGSNLPAPPFKVTGIDNQGLPEPVDRITSTASELPVPDGAPDITISTQKTVCEPVVADTLTVTGTGVLRAGLLGETVKKTITDDDGHQRTIDVPCDGMLDIYARNVFVSSGGLISASGTRNNDGLGTPAARSAGAGHTGEGGSSYAGDGGTAYGLGSGGDSVSIDPGSRGAHGHVPGGRGGGVVSINAAEQVTISGTIAANGVKPGQSTTFSTSCAAVAGGGGGSGGAIAINSPYLSIRSTAFLLARGGAGGNATFGHAGGGGGGGVVAANGVIRTYNGTVDVDGGDEGSGHGNCEGAGTGDDGEEDEGEEFKRGATVTVDAPPDAGFYRDGTVPRLDVRAIDSAMEFETEYGFTEEGVGQEKVYVCLRYEPPGAPGGIASRQLNPPASAVTADQLLEDSAACRRLDFEDRTRPCPTTSCNDFEFRRNISTDTLLGNVYADEKDGFPLPIFGPNAADGVLDGFYGVYAFTVYDPFPGLTTDHVTYTSPLPKVASARFAIDRTPPRLAVARVTDPIEGCPGGTRCVNEPVGHADITAADDVSGLVSAKCNADFGAGVSDCRSGAYTFSLKDIQGFHHLTAELKDNAGYIQYFNEAARWFLDSVKPDAPTLDLVSSGTPTNGWYRKAPQVTVHAVDRDKSSGFTAEAVRFSVDSATVECGLPVTGDGFSTETNECTPAMTDDIVPPDGRHLLSAYVVDRAGNQSEASAPVEMKVDAEDPSSAMKLVGAFKPAQIGQPRRYTTRPIVTFAATDQPGGSGVEAPPKRGSGVRFKIDTKPYGWWDPSEEGTIRLSDGAHTVCWYAVDVAGNEENEQCQQGIVVDATAPVPSLGAAPAAPDAQTGWHRVPVVIDPSASDGDGSHVDTVEMRIGAGDWVPAERTMLRDGIHEVAIRATDRAGNVSERLEATLKIDVVAPGHELGTFPPAANEQGWFRRRPVVALAARDGLSGPAGVSYQLGSDPFGDYLMPFHVQPGRQVLAVEPRDVAGNRGTIGKRDLRVDVTPPVPSIATPAPDPVQVPLTGAPLRFTVADDLASTVRVRVFVHDALNRLVRTLDAGQRGTGPGSVTWDGRDATGLPAPPGLYTYRVEALDAAGNSAGSTESAQFVVLAPKLLPG